MRRNRFTRDDYSDRHKRRLAQQETEKSIRHVLDVMNRSPSVKKNKILESDSLPKRDMANSSINLTTNQQKITSTNSKHPTEKIVTETEVDGYSSNKELLECTNDQSDFIGIEKESTEGNFEMKNSEEKAIFDLDEEEENYRYSDADDDGDDDASDCLENNSYKLKWGYLLDSQKDDGKERDSILAKYSCLLEKIRPKETESELITRQLKSILPRWTVDCNIDQASITKLLHEIREKVPSIQLPLDCRTLLKTPRSTVTFEIAGGQYHHFGLNSCLEKLIICQQKKVIVNNKIELLINVDGAPVGKSSEKSLWPILCSDKILKKVYIVGVFYGTSKPNDADEFIQHFVNEAVDYVTNGFTFNDQSYDITIDGIICDAPAKAYLLGIKCHSGYSSCTKCDIYGTYRKGVCFPNENSKPRTDEKFKNFEYLKEKFQLKRTSLTKIPKLGLVTGVPLDPMHLLFLGVVRKIIYILLFGATRRKLPAHIINAISQILIALRDHVPYEFARKPRDLKYIKIFKATEFRLTGAYTGIVAFRKHLSASVYKNFCTLHVIISIYSNPLLIKDPEWIDYAEKLSKKFVNKFQQLYGTRYVSHNIHNFQHLADDVRRYGELDNFSAFRFENFIAQIKRYIRSGNRPLQQLARRCKEVEILQDSPIDLNEEKNLKQPHSQGPLTNNFNVVDQYNVGTFHGFTVNCTDDKNNYLLINQHRVIRALNIVVDQDEETYLIGQELDIIQPIFTYPCSSSLLGQHVVSQSLDAPLGYWNVRSISAKLFKMPFDDNLAVLPILHTLQHVG